MDPVFSARAAGVMNSGYWFANKPATKDRAQIIAWNNEALAKREAVEQVINSSPNYESMPDDVRQIFDEVEAFNATAGG